MQLFFVSSRTLPNPNLVKARKLTSHLPLTVKPLPVQVRKLYITSFPPFLGVYRFIKLPTFRSSTAKRLAAASSTKTTMSYTSAIMTSTSRSAGATTGSGGASAKQAATAGQTFAAKLSSMEAGPIFGATAPLTLQSQLPPTSSTIVVNSSMHLTASIGSTAGFSTLTITPPISSVVPVITNSSQTVSPALSTVSTCAVTSSVVMVSPPQPQQVNGYFFRYGPYESYATLKFLILQLQSPCFTFKFLF